MHHWNWGTQHWRMAWPYQYPSYPWPLSNHVYAPVEHTPQKGMTWRGPNQGGVLTNYKEQELDVDQTKVWHVIWGRRYVVWSGINKDLWIKGRCSISQSVSCSISLMFDGMFDELRLCQVRIGQKRQRIQKEEGGSPSCLIAPDEVVYQDNSRCSYISLSTVQQFQDWGPTS